MAEIVIGRVLDAATDSITVEQGALTPPWSVQQVAQLVPMEYDDLSLNYSGPDLTSVVYRTGGPAGVVVATLTLTWLGGNLTHVTRT